jgi:hypothetical protein
MKVIRPITITDAILTSSTVTEADYAEFAMGTTYATGDRCIVATGLEILTLDVAPASDWAAGDIVTGQTSAKTCVVVSKITSLTYYVRERSGAFALGETIGVTGTAAKLADQGAAHPTFTAATDKVHKIYESVADSNTGNYPPTDVLVEVPKWVEIGSTNRWKVFDRKVGSQTSNAASMNYVFTPRSRIDSIALLNLDATSVQIVVTDPVDGEVYNVTTDLINPSVVYDWYTYFVEPIGTLKTDLVTTEIPIYAAATVSITINYTGGTAACGSIILGRKFELGAMKYSPSIGITDYSTKSVDTFGNYTITERAYSKRLSCDVTVKNIYLDEVVRQLSMMRATLLVWIGSADYSSLIAYGFYKDFSVVIPYIKYSVCSLEIEGIT